ncbi:MAG: hypothetical protein K2W95_26450 [Candidatus Obscuribacterales bacterium]|nr:hypothetical protein [Candidatus Obscuribacterales bacterium]
MTGPAKDNDKTQFGKDAVDEKSSKVSTDVLDDMGKMDQAKVVERPRSSDFKYTGSAYPKLMMVGTGEIAKIMAAKAEGKEDFYDHIAAQGAKPKATGEVSKEKRLSVEIKKFTQEHQKAIEEHKKLSLLDGLQKYKAEAEKPEISAENAPVVYESNSNAPDTVKYPDGKVRQFTFDENGDVSAISFEDPAKQYKDSWQRVPGTDTWEQHNAEGKKTGEVFEGGVGVDEQGNLTRVPRGADVATVETSDGKKWTFHKDGPGVLVDANGRIEEIDYPNDTNAQVKHDEDGQLCEIQFPDGVKWRKAEGDHWVAVEDNGKALDSSHSFFGQIDVSNDGSIKMLDTTGNTAVFNPDGTRTTLYNDGSVVDTNPEGRISKVVYPSPKDSSIKFEYSPTGALTTITHGNGEVWQRGRGNEWTSSTTGEKWKGEVLVNPDGSYTAKEAGQNGRLTENTNGSKILHMADGSARVENTDGSVVKVTKAGTIGSIDYPQGQKREFSYKNSTLTEVTYEDREIGFKDTWKKQNDTWVQYQDGKATGKRWAGEITLDQSTGEFVYQSRGSNELAVEKTDGAVLTITDSGVKEVRTADGEEQKYSRNSEGVIDAFNDKDGKWTSKDGINWRNETGGIKVGVARIGDDGTFSFRDREKTRFDFSGGTSMELSTDGGRKIYDRDGRLAETVDAAKRVYKYGYNQDGDINKVTGPDGVTWKTDNGKNWTTPDGKQVWNGTVEQQKDGSLKLYDQDSKTETTYALDGSKKERNRDPESANYGRVTVEKGGKTTVERPAVDRIALEKSADAFFLAADGAFTDIEGMQAQLQGKTEEERQVMNEIFKTKRGYDLEAEIIDEMGEGADREKSLALLRRKDDVSDDSGFVKTALAERGQYIEGASDEEIESRLRQKIASMTADDIARMNDEFKATDPQGRTAIEAIAANPDLSAETKNAIALYAKGRENVTDKDMVSIADDAIAAGNIEAFKEAMSQASPEARAAFMQNDGEAKMKQAFGGHWYNALSLGMTGNVFDVDLRHAEDYAENGKLAAETLVEDNTSWAGDSEKDIEHALDEMTDEERKQYARGKELAAASVEPTTLEGSKRADYDYYHTLKSALADAASNETEMRRWEDMIATKGGSIISKAAEHRGSFYDDSVQTVLTDIEKMSEKDWKRLKNEPEFRKEIEAMYGSYLGQSEMAKVTELLDKKEASTSYKESVETARRPIRDFLESAKNGSYYDPAKVAEAMVNMTPDEREAYKNNTDGLRDYLKSIQIASPNTNSQIEYIGGKIDAGKTPLEDIVTQMYAYQNQTDSDEAEVVGKIQAAFEKDPALRERLKNPQTEEDKQFAATFDTAVRGAVGTFDYDNYVKPLLDEGHLPIAKITALYKGVFTDDEVGFYTALRNASAEDLEAVARDPGAYLGFLDPEERSVAENIAKQKGQMRPEDKIRAYQLGAGTMEQEIKDVLATLTPQQLEQTKREYAHKYGTDLTADLLSELGGKDAREVSKMLERPKLAADAHSDALEEWSKSRSGIGGEFVDAVWDGSGYQADEAMFGYSKAMSAYAQALKEMPEAEQKQFTEGLTKALDLYVQSKGALGDAIVDATLAVAAIGAAAFSGGVSLGLLAAVGVGGGVFKTATKAAVVGSDYDVYSTDLLTDFATGSVDAAVSFVGPGQIAKIFKVGEVAAAKAATKTVEVAGSLMKEGSESALKAEMAAVVRNALVSGSKEISQKELAAIAVKTAVAGSEQEVATIIKLMAESELAEQSKSFLKSLGRQYALEMTAGGIGGGLSGAIRGATQWEDGKSALGNVGNIAINALKGTGFGVGGAAAFKTVFESAGTLLDALKTPANTDDLSSAISSQIDNSGSGGGNGGDVPELPAPELPLRGSAVIDETPTKQFTAVERPASPDNAPDRAVDDAVGDGSEVDPYAETGVFEVDNEPTQIANRPDLDQQPTQIFERPVMDEEPTQIIQLPDFHEEPAQIFENPFAKPGTSEASQGPPDINDQPTQIFQRPNFNEEPTPIIQNPGLHEEPTQIFQKPVLPPANPPDIHEEPTQIFQRPDFDEEPDLVDFPDDIHNEPTQIIDIESLKDSVKSNEKPSFDEPGSVKFEKTEAPDATLPKPDIDGPVTVKNITNALDGGPEQLPNGKSPLGSRLEFEVGGEAFPLVRTPGDSFFYDHFPSSTDQVGPIKVHVNGVGQKELRDLQAILIPAMMKDPELKSLITGWKTLDPRFGTDGSSPVVKLGPTGKDQGAKAFTIYSKNPADALKVQARIDEILAQYPELVLKSPMDTNNVDVVFGKSNRVGVVRDRFEKAADATAVDQRARVDDEVVSKIMNDKDLAKRAASNRKSIGEQLEEDLGLAPGTLHVDNQGEFSLVLSGTSRDEFDEYENFAYLQEQPFGKKPGELRDRSAMYAVYQKYGVDPSKVAMPDMIRAGD